MKYLYHRYDKTTRRNTTIELDRETGLPLITFVQDTKPVVEHAKRLASNFDKHKRNPEGWTHVATIPVVIWQRLEKLGITRDPVAFNALLNSREYRQLRTDDARRL